MRRLGAILLVFSCAALYMTPVHAVPLNVGDVQVALFEAEPAGGAVIDSLVSPFVVPGKFSGTLVTEVIAGDVTNPFGGLTFVYTLSNDPLSANPITAITINGWAGSATDASYETPGVAPTWVDRYTADTVGFRFQEPAFIPGFGVFGNGILTAGSTSASLVLQSNLNAYTTNIAQVIDGAIVDAPVLVPVPEPSTLALAGLGLAFAWCVARRKR